MKTTKKIAIFFLLTGMIIFIGQSAVWARGCDVPKNTPSPIVTDSRAKGTKLSGTVTISYETPVPGDLTGPALIKFFMRLLKGKALYVFAGTADITEMSDLGEIQTALLTFIEGTVVPDLFEGASYPAVLKAVDMVAEPDEYGTANCCYNSDGNYMFFTILDVVYAVQD